MALRYGVIGTGALGGFYGGMLAHAGQEVHFLFRSDYEHVQKNGLQVNSKLGDFRLGKMHAYSDVHQMPACDVVLVCIKTTGNHLLPKLLPPLLHPGTVVLLLQNGLGLEKDLEAQLPGTKIAGGLAFICCNKTGPGQVQHLDYGNLNVGAYSVSDRSLLQHVVGDLQAAGVPAELSEDLLFARWQKLVWNVPFNGLTVVMDATTDQLVRDDAMQQLVRELMIEVIHGANHCGVNLPLSLAQKMIDLTLNMTPYAPSMKLDYDFCRPMEIESIYSKPVQIAAQAGFVMHRISMLEKQLRFIQATRNRKP